MPSHWLQGEDGLPKVHSTSLRSLHTREHMYESDYDSDILFLGLFSHCHIDSLDIYSGLLEEVIRLFSNIRYLHFWVSSSIIVNVVSAILSRMSDYEQADLWRNNLGELYERNRMAISHFPNWNSWYSQSLTTSRVCNQR